MRTVLHLCCASTCTSFVSLPLCLPVSFAHPNENWKLRIQLSPSSLGLHFPFNFSLLEPRHKQIPKALELYFNLRVGERGKRAKCEWKGRLWNEGRLLEAKLSSQVITKLPWWVWHTRLQADRASVPCPFKYTTLALSHTLACRAYVFYGCLWEAVSQNRSEPLKDINLFVYSPSSYDSLLYSSSQLDVNVRECWIIVQVIVYMPVPSIHVCALLLALWFIHYQLYCSLAVLPHTV